jgi:hypothetical protein
MVVCSQNPNVMCKKLSCKRQSLWISLIFVFFSLRSRKRRRRRRRSSMKLQREKGASELHKINNKNNSRSMSRRRNYGNKWT